ncbi:MAG: flagellar hook-length control protein FliK [Woeseiaceae bacterium]|nr:flagellar hook-length control protein FliK [Woeseiaceae bacterium]
MLPLLNLTSSEKLSTDALQGAVGLMPEASNALQGGFASVLRSTAHPAAMLQAPSGEDLPLAGNVLPVTIPVGELPLDADIELQIDEVDLASLGLQQPSSEADADSATVTLAVSTSPETVDAVPADGGLPVTTHVPPQPQPDDHVVPVPPVTTALNGEDDAAAMLQRPVASPLANAGERGISSETHDRGLDVATLRQRNAVVREGQAGYPPHVQPADDDGLRPVPVREAVNDERLQLPLRREFGNETAALSRPAAELPATRDDLPRAVRDDGMPPPRPVQLPAWQTATVSAEPVPEPGQRIHVELSAATPRAAAAPPPPAASLPPAAQMIDVPVQQSGWDNLLADRVTMMANGRVQNAELRLTPAELGPLRIQLEIDDGVANVSFQSQHPVTREALEQAMPRLRELLAENGLSLGQADVRDDNGRQRSGETLADAAATTGTGGDFDDVDETATSRVSRGAGNNLVDTFV